LPEGYDSTRKYAVIYMNDGQMLFDSTTTWNKQEWGADEVAAKLIAENKIRPCIIVGIWNRDQYRYSEYFPEKALSFFPKRRRASLIRKEMMGEPLGDKYLRFLVSELKPYIDSHYSTFTDRENTIIMGSSMGGLISLYAICEYPDVFGGAGCISTHLPMIGVNWFRKYDNRMAKSFRKYLSANLPSPENHKIYFDYGTKTLDAAYGPYQKKVDKLMSAAGYSEKNWTTIKYEGHDHSERSWASRLNIPFEFLLGK
jgi:predicted alpha/beta superfamily hydrolase